VKQRIRIRTSAAYGSDVDPVRQILLDAAGETDQVCREPEPRVRFREFGDSGLVFELLCWIENPVFRGQVQDALNTAVYKAFAREGVEIPYPKRDVYIKGMPAAQTVPASKVAASKSSRS
jgi:small-conductance mechanosensitive channel